MANASFDDNSNRTLIAGSNADSGETPIRLYADSVTNRLLVSSTITGTPTVQISGSSGDGSILDGVDTGIKASVLDYASSNPLAVRLTDTNGDYTAAGGGTEYNNGSAIATPIGKVALGYDGANVRALKVDSTGALSVSGTANVTIVGSLPSGSNILGTVTVNSLPSVTVGSLPALASGSNVVGSVSITGGSISLAAGTNNIGDVDVLTLPALPAGGITIGTVTIGALQAGSNIIGTVTVNSLPSVTLNALPTGSNTVGTVTVKGQPLPDSAVYGTASITSKTSTQIVAAQGTGIKSYITSAIVSNSGTTSVDVELVNGVTRAVIPAPCGTAGINVGGATMSFGYPGLPGLANTAWNALPSATTTVKITLVGYNSTL